MSLEVSLAFGSSSRGFDVVSDQTPPPEPAPAPMPSFRFGESALILFTMGSLAGLVYWIVRG